MGEFNPMRDRCACGHATWRHRGRWDRTGYWCDMCAACGLQALFHNHYQAQTMGLTWDGHPFAPCDCKQGENDG